MSRDFMYLQSNDAVEGNSAVQSWVRFGAIMRAVPLCDTEFMAVAADPKSVKVNLSTGTGLDIEWKDGHQSHYSFPFLRDACPCALCDEERSKTHQQPGEPAKLSPGALPMFKPAIKATSAEGVGKYAIKFHFNDGHELGIYSWQFLRDWCPCEECKAARASEVPRR
ncbi:MAG TPA: DUF971 domain-containing protein [Terriglobales bacterium]|nr:DUF971 domain-containing protein [Terriglobales bacterium]